MLNSVVSSDLAVFTLIGCGSRVHYIHYINSRLVSTFVSSAGELCDHLVGIRIYVR